jgi:hypothetical protein
VTDLGGRRVRPGSTRSRVAVAGIGVLVAGVLLGGCSQNTSITPPSSHSGDDTARADRAQQTVASLVTALTAHDTQAAGSLGIGAGRALLGAAAENVRAIGISDLAMRFVEDNGADPADVAAYGSDAWGATIEVTYRIAPWDGQATTVDVPAVFVPGTSGQDIAAFGGTDGRTPLWLQGPVTPLRSGRALVLLRAGSASTYLALVRQALIDVAKVLPSWKGSLVLEVPATEQELDEALDATQQEYADIAAVTASVDGSLLRGSPVHVFLNPRVFGGLGPRGAQVVVSHESTHVAMGATFSTMPTWLLEGFADYVALAHAGIPVGTAAGQILARIRKQGAPDHLPSAAELDPTANGLGATYEEAWLATRFIARMYGEAALVAFYRRVDAGLALPAAFQRVLGTSEDAFVTAWRNDLRALAAGRPG